MFSERCCNRRSLPKIQLVCVQVKEKMGENLGNTHHRFLFFFSDTEITVATGDGASMDVRALPEKEGGRGREGERKEGVGGQGGGGAFERERARVRERV